MLFRHNAGLQQFKPSHVLVIALPQRTVSSQNFESHKNIIVQDWGSFVHSTKESKTKMLTSPVFRGAFFKFCPPLSTAFAPTLTSFATVPAVLLRSEIQNKGILKVAWSESRP